MSPEEQPLVLPGVPQLPPPPPPQATAMRITTEKRPTHHRMIGPSVTAAYSSRYARRVEAARGAVEGGRSRCQVRPGIWPTSSLSRRRPAGVWQKVPGLLEAA